MGSNHCCVKSKQCRVNWRGLCAEGTPVIFSEPCLLGVFPVAQSSASMYCSKYDIRAAFLILANALFLAGGVGLVAVGALLLDDTERVLTSRLILTPLPQPLLYYIALMLMSLGLILTSLAVLGCWAAHLHNYCLLAFYLFMLVILLVAECVVSILAILCPQYLGLNLDREELQDSWQRNYGVPGREQYTAAVDLVQTQFQCCGVNSGTDYSISWWRLRELAPPTLLVPLSCCILQQPAEFLDPKPLNTTVCQDAHIDNFRTARHLEGCLDRLNAWLMDHIMLMLSGGLGLVFLELLLLLLTLLTCIRQYQKPPPTHKSKSIDVKHKGFPYGVSS